MGINTKINRSLFLRLDQIAKAYGVQWYYYNYFLTRNYDSSAQYFIMFHESYRKKVETLNIVKEYEKISNRQGIGWKIIKINEKYPLETIMDVIEFGKWAELIHNLFDRYNVMVPEDCSRGYEFYVTSRYRSVLDTSRDKGMRFIDSNYLNYGIKTYHDEKVSKELVDNFIKKGGVLKTKYEDHLLELPVTNSNYVSEEEIFRHGEIERMGIDYYNLIKFEEKMKEYPDIIYHRTTPFMEFDNRTHMVNGERFDGSKEDDVSAYSVLYFRKKDKKKIIEIFFDSLYPCLEKVKNVKLDFTQGIVQIGLPMPFINKFDKKMRMYELKYGIDNKIRESNGYILSVIVEPHNGPLVWYIIDEIVKDMIYHIYNPELEFELYPGVKYEIDKIAERKRLAQNNMPKN